MAETLTERARRLADKIEAADDLVEYEMEAAETLRAMADLLEPPAHGEVRVVAMIDPDIATEYRRAAAQFERRDEMPR